MAFFKYLVCFFVVISKLISGFELQEELIYCLATDRIDFSNSCPNNNDLCIKKQNFLLTYISVIDFFFKYGNYSLIIHLYKVDII